LLYDLRKSSVFNACLKVFSDGNDVIADGSMFQTLTAATGKAHTPMVLCNNAERATTLSMKIAGVHVTQMSIDSSVNYNNSKNILTPTTAGFQFSPITAKRLN